MAVTHVQLGGELRGRSIFGGSRNKLERIGMWSSIAVLVVVQVAVMQWSWTILVGGVMLAAIVFVWSPRPSFGHRSVVGIIAIPLRRRWNGRMGTLDTVGGIQAQASDERVPHLPAAVGRLRQLHVELWPGMENPGEVVILRQRRHDAVQYTMVMEFRAQQGGSFDSLAGLRNHAGWAKLQAALARRGSLVRHSQQVARIVPFDPADHVHWLIDSLPEKPPELLVKSYAELVDNVISQQEQNRTWVVLGVPGTRDLYAAADRVSLSDEFDEVSDQERADARTAEVLATELRRVISAGRSAGFEFRPLDERRLAAVTRSLQDPDQPLDRLEDADRFSMWLPWIGSESSRYMVVEGSERRWFTRVAVVPRDGFAAGELPVDMLVPLLTGVHPAVVRTVSTHFTFVPATTARTEARDDVTMDRTASQQSAKQVSDGTSEAQMSASQRRLEDLRPGSGVHGAEWALAIAIQASTADELERAINAIDEAAAEAQISNLTWQDHAHHLAMPLTLPLASGVQRRKRKWLAA